MFTGSRRVTARGLALLAAAILWASCAPTLRAPLPGRPSIFEVKMTEYRFDYERAPKTVGRGRAAFSVRNAGRLDHELILIVIPKNLPMTLKEQIRSPQQAAFEPLVHLRPHGPGSRGLFAVDLPAGRYGLVCLVEDADGRTHAAKGMSAEFRVA